MDKEGGPMAETIEHRATVEYVETVQRQGVDAQGNPKKPYYRVHFAEGYTLGEYDGNQATLWSETAAKLINERTKGTQAIYLIEASTVNPAWSGTIVRIMDSTGEVLYEPTRSRKTGPRTKPPGNWETQAEREFKEASILVQKAAGVLVAMCGQGDVQANYRFLAEHLEDLASRMRDATLKVLAKGGYPATGYAATEASPAPPGSTVSSGTVAAPGGSGGAAADLAASRNRALSTFGRPRDVELAYERAFGISKRFTEMGAGELEELLEHEAAWNGGEG